MSDDNFISTKMAPKRVLIPALIVAGSLLLAGNSTLYYGISKLAETASRIFVITEEKREINKIFQGDYGCAELIEISYKYNNQEIQSSAQQQMAIQCNHQNYFGSNSDEELEKVLNNPDTSRSLGLVVLEEQVKRDRMGQRHGLQ